DPFGEARVVPDVAGEDDVGIGRLLVEHIPMDHVDAAAVGTRVERNRGYGEGVDVRARRPGGTGLHRGDGAQSGARRQIEHARSHPASRLPPPNSSKNSAAWDGGRPSASPMTSMTGIDNRRTSADQS